MAETIRVLILEDSASDAALMVQELRLAGFEPEWERVETEQEFAARLNATVSVVLSDFSLPQFDALRALQLLLDHGLNIPFIIVSGSIGEDTAVNAMKMGAADYLLKDRLGRLGPAVKNAIEQTRLRGEKRAGDQAFLRSQLHTSAIIASALECIISINSAGQIVEFNPAAEKVFDYSRELILGKPIVEWLIPVEFRERHSRGVHRLLTTGEPSILNQRIEVAALRASGEVFPIELTITRSVFPDGPVFTAFLRDITERKRAETERRADEARLHLLTEELQSERRRLIAAQAVAKVGSWETDLQTLNVAWSEETYRIFETDPALFRPTHAGFLSFVHPDDRRAVDDAFRTSFNTTETCVVEHRLLMQDHRIKYVEERWNVVCDEFGQPQRAIGTCQDITERRHSEAEMRRISELLRAVAEQTPDAMFVKDQQGRYLFFNAAASRFVGRDAADVIGRDDTELFDPDGARRVMERDRRVFTSGLAETEEEELTAAGTTRTYLASKSPFRDAAGNVVGVVGISSDITDRKRAENQVVEANRRFEETLEAVSDLFAAFDQDWNYTYLNSKAAAFTGHKPEELVGKNIWELFPQAVGKRFYHELHDAIATQSIRRFSEFYPEFGRTYEHRAYPHPRGLSLFSSDITESLRTQDALRQSEAKLTEAIKLAHIGYWSRNLVTGVLDWSDELFEIFGIESKSFGRDFDSFLNAVHPEDLQRVRERIAQAVATVGAFEHTYRIVASGSVKAISEIGRVIASEDGTALRVAGTAQDVTLRFMAEKALRQSEEQLRHIISNSPFPMMVHAEDGEVRLISNSWTDLTGYSIEEIQTLDAWTRRAYGDRHKSQLRRISSFNLISKRQHIGEFELTTKAGACLIWDFWATPLGRLPDGRRFLLRMATDVTEQKNAQKELRILDRAIQAVTQGILITDVLQEDNPIIYASPGFETVTGYSNSEVIGRNCRFLQGPDTDMDAVKKLRVAIQQGEPCAVELLNYRKDGTPFWNEVVISPIRNNDGELTNFVGSQMDVTARRRMAAQLNQMQKMEAVGRLAGGIAHDFNNLLTIIIGYSELLLTQLSSSDPRYEITKQIKLAGDRAAGLTQQLLAFSRRQVVQFTELDLNTVIRNMESMLQRLIGEDIEIDFNLKSSLPTILADRGQMEQVLLNLCLNARDAMPRGGMLTIETGVIEFDDAYIATHPGMRLGIHVMVAVGDTGCGMEKSTLAQIFEPFFTTKAPNKGTGLGLATVYGIVTQSGGHIEAYSELGQGTTFKVYLPGQLSEAQPMQSVVHEVAEYPVGTETILLVEDEVGVRTLAARLLEERGYRVLQASRADEALESYALWISEIQLVITDVVMPGMSGRELVDQLRKQSTELKVIYMSAYTEDAIIRNGVLSSDCEFIQKPFTSKTLSAKVRMVLDCP